MNLQRYVNLAFAVVGLVAWVVSAAFFTFAIELIDVDWNHPIIGADFRLADVLGLLVGIGTGLYMKFSKSINEWSLEVVNELKKVTWPNWDETRLGTIVVIITSIVLALILGLFDYIWAFVTSHLYGMG